MPYLRCMYATMNLISWTKAIIKEPIATDPRWYLQRNVCHVRILYTVNFLLSFHHQNKTCIAFRNRCLFLSSFDCTRTQYIKCGTVTALAFNIINTCTPFHPQIINNSMVYVCFDKM